jgi:hypothetical protein
MTSLIVRSPPYFCKDSYVMVPTSLYNTLLSSECFYLFCLEFLWRLSLASISAPVNAWSGFGGIGLLSSFFPKCSLVVTQLRIDLVLI